MYRGGRGVAQDYSQAAIWFRMAAEKGDADAQLLLGLHYEYGNGVPQDYAQAAIWYRKAADQDVADAQNNLGSLYENGLGVPQHYVEACFWLTLAAAGATEAHQEVYAKRRDATALKLTPSEQSNVRRRVNHWHPSKSTQV